MSLNEIVADGLKKTYMLSRGSVKLNLTLYSALR
jgi:hypothetical protein